MNSTDVICSFLERIKRADRDFCLFDGTKKILVGLSGGADSTALLLSLKKLSQELGFELFAVHVNHMIRGNEADRDEEFARRLCEKYGVDFACERVDVPKLAKEKGESLELCARNVRYDIFKKICTSKGIAFVATAHNSCDNSETVLFNLVRGSGTKGMCGIPPKRELCDNIRIIRPLIYATRNEIEEFLSACNQDFVTDSTNADCDYSRNFLRNEVLPLLRKLNPSLEDGIRRTSDLHRKDEECLSKMARESVTDGVEELKKLDEAILSRVIIRLFEGVSDETPSYERVKELCGKIYSFNGKKMKVSFSDSMTATLFENKLVFEKDLRLKKGTKTEFFRLLNEGGNFFEENSYALYITFDESFDIPQTLENEENIYKIYTTDYLYFDTIPNGLSARSRCDGDKIFSCSMHKSLKRLLNAEKLSESEKRMLPVVEKDGEIILVPGVCVCDDCKKKSNGKVKASVSLYVKNKKEWC